MTEREEPMAIRVLATIPELPVAPERVAPVEAAIQQPVAAPRPTTRRTRPRASFPGVSVAALALIATAIWSLVAIREVTRQHPRTETPRIATEAVDAGATETTLR